MKVAIGILAFSAPLVLEQSLRHWPAESFEIFIHVDQKIDIGLYEFVSQYPNARIISSRFDIFWGGFNMVLAEIELMRLCAQDPGFDYFMLLSDDSIPLRDARSVLAELQSHKNWRLFSPNTSSGIKERYNSFVCYDIEASHPRHVKPYKIEDFDALLSLRLLMEKGKAPLDNLFHGQQWMALTARDVQYAIGFHDTNPDIQRSFRFSSVPDEMYIQTIIGMSGERRRHFARFVFADFSRQPAPYILEDRSDLVGAVENGYLFARKIRDPDFAAAVLQHGPYLDS